MFVQSRHLSFFALFSRSGFLAMDRKMKFVINLQRLAKFCIRRRVIGDIIIIISKSPTEVDLTNYKHETRNFGKFDEISSKVLNLTENFS